MINARFDMDTLNRHLSPLYYPGSNITIDHRLPQEQVSGVLRLTGVLTLGSRRLKLAKFLRAQACTIGVPCHSSNLRKLPIRVPIVTVSFVALMLLVDIRQHRKCAKPHLISWRVL